MNKTEDNQMHEELGEEESLYFTDKNIED